MMLKFTRLHAKSQDMPTNAIESARIFRETETQRRLSTEPGHENAEAG
jgi:hypothetical protein